MEPEKLFAQYVSDEESSSTHKKWVQANPNGDAPKWKAYRDSVFAYKEGGTHVPSPQI
jgi:hypothetical protein